MKFASTFDVFLREHVNLDRARLDAMERRMDALTEYLSDDPVFGAILVDMIPAGSRAHRTIIKPVTTSRGFDADVLVLVAPQADWQPKDYCQRLYETLCKSDEYSGRVHRKTRCVRVLYEPDFHVDLVPYIESDGRHYITNRSEPPATGAFELSDPEKFNEWMFERAQATNGTFVKVIRLIKYLHDFKTTFACKSIILTTLLGGTINPSGDGTDDPAFKDVPTALVTLMTRLADTLPPSYPQILDPGGTGDDFADRYRDTWNYENFRTVMAAYAAKMQAALEEDDRDTSLALWRDLFGHEFGPTQTPVVKAAEAHRAAAPHDGEQFIDQPPFNYPIQMRPGCSVRILARAEDVIVGGRKFRRGFRPFNLPTSGGRAPKSRQLIFKASVRCPAPYKLFWKVRNGGDEAAAVGQLRGEITEDRGAESKSETTKYSGRHYVGCYVVKDGRVVARARHDVIIP